METYFQTNSTKTLRGIYDFALGEKMRVKMDPFVNNIQVA